MYLLISLPYKVGVDGTGFSGWISERLWKAAKDKLGVTPPAENSTPNPDVSLARLEGKGDWNF